VLGIWSEATNMSFLNFKRKTKKKAKEEIKEKSKKKEAEKKEAEKKEKKDVRKSEKKLEEEKEPLKKEIRKSGYLDTTTLIKPMITEKATGLQAQNCYVFEVATKANKIMVKKAIKNFYNVEPIKINIVRLKGKQVRYGRSIGTTKKRKKAIVFLKKGDKIEFTSK
jgi:large subunit ribosomal protein L23